MTSRYAVKGVSSRHQVTTVTSLCISATIVSMRRVDVDFVGHLCTHRMAICLDLFPCFDPLREWKAVLSTVRSCGHNCLEGVVRDDRLLAQTSFKSQSELNPCPSCRTLIARGTPTLRLWMVKLSTCKGSLLARPSTTHLPRCARA